MTEVSVLEAKWMQDGAGDWLCLRVPTALSAMDVVDELQPGKEYRAQIKRKGRSLDANAYCWVLMDKLAAHYGATKEGIYQEEIRQIAGVSDIVCVQEKAADELMRLFESVNAEGQTIVMVTHSLRAASRARRVLFIKDGEVFHQLYRASLSTEEFYQRISDALTLITTGGAQNA